MRLERTPARIDVTGETLERLPPELEAFVRSAADGEFPNGTVTRNDGAILNMRESVTSWACLYLTGNQGDRGDALDCLWFVHRTVQAQLQADLN
jgi:hypothetical protein